MNSAQSTTAIDPLLEKIDTHEHTKASQSSGQLILNATELELCTMKEKFESFWIDLFISEFLSDDVLHDDLLFFVRRPKSRQTDTFSSERTSPLPKQGYGHKLDRSHEEQPEQIELFRKDSKRMPIGDQDIDWKQTVYLNYILQSFTYTITCAISKTDNDQHHATRKHSVEVFSSPSARHMSLNKAKDERITYPDIYFAVDRYEEFLHEISISDGQILWIELVATNKKTGTNSSLFLGSIAHGTMSKSLKSARFLSGCSMLQSQMDMREMEFIPVRGPGSIGRAEIALLEHKNDKKLTYQPTAARRSVDLEPYEFIDIDPYEIQVIPEINKVNILSSSMNFLCFPMMKKAHRVLKHRRSMSEGNLTVDCEMQVHKSDSPSKKRLESDRRPLTSNHGKSSDDGLLKDTYSKNKFMAIGNLRTALNFCRSKPKQFVPNPMIINAYITNINMKWSHIIDELKISRAPTF